MSTVQVHWRLDDDLHREVVAYAAALGKVSVNDAARILLKQALAAGPPAGTIQRGGGGWISGPSTTTRKET